MSGPPSAAIAAATARSLAVNSYEKKRGGVRRGEERGEGGRDNKGRGQLGGGGSREGWGEGVREEKKGRDALS